MKMIFCGHFRPGQELGGDITQSKREKVMKAKPLRKLAALLCVLLLLLCLTACSGEAEKDNDPKENFPQADEVPEPEPAPEPQIRRSLAYL